MNTENSQNYFGNKFFVVSIRLLLYRLNLHIQSVYKNFETYFSHFWEKRFISVYTYFDFFRWMFLKNIKTSKHLMNADIYKWVEKGYPPGLLIKNHFVFANGWLVFKFGGIDKNCDSILLLPNKTNRDMADVLRLFFFGFFQNK